MATRKQRQGITLRVDAKGYRKGRGLYARLLKNTAGLGAVRTDVVKRLVVDIRNAVALDTPIDTGRATASWAAAQGRPRLEFKQPASYRGNKSRAIKDGLVDLGSIDTRKGDIGFGGSFDGRFFISNSLPYVRNLNNGSSMQAPKRFVQRAFGRAIRDFRAPGLKK